MHAHETKSAYLQAWLLNAARTDNMIKSFKDVNLRHKNRTRITGQEWHVHRRIPSVSFFDRPRCSSKYGQKGGVHLIWTNQRQDRPAMPAVLLVSRMSLFNNHIWSTYLPTYKIISRRFSSGKNLKMAESEEAEDSVDYYAVLNVRKEVKIVFQREIKREIFDQSF